MFYLDKVNSVEDIKKLQLNELEGLAEDIRAAILNRDSKIGGHVGSNLGIVEATVALHYVFDSPRDKIVFDVSHQCYPHKILTGRKAGFVDDDKLMSVSGYTNPSESEHDFFVVGHTSTSVSLACGLAKARDIRGEKHNVVALIGDGSLSGGEALEGFSNAAVLGSNMIIIVNDNEMSIAENQGGLYTNLRLLRETGGLAACNMFKALGFEYHYVADGNSLPQMIEVLKKVKDIGKPTVIHIHTLKGKGYHFAENDKEAWHWNLPFDIESGKVTIGGGAETYHEITAKYLTDKVAKDSNVVVVNAGTPGAVGLTPEVRRQLGRNFVDVGIAEEHAVAMSSALAKGGCKPVYMVWSSFIQRTYDQLSQDLAINNNPAVILVFGGGISAMDVTHLGCFDMPLIANIPNIVYLAPASKEEYLAMLDWGIEQTEHPVVIRVPQAVVSGTGKIDQNYNTPAYREVRKGSRAAILALGSFLQRGEAAADLLRAKGIEATVINPRFVSVLDEKTLEALKQNHRVIATLEDGVLDGGFGEKIARYYGADKMKVLNFGAEKKFTDRVPLELQYKRNRLMPEQIAEDIWQVLSDEL